MTRVVVYTTGDACMQCRLTKQVMDAVGLAFESIDITEPAHARDRDHVTRDLGYASAPVVEIDGCEHWSGFEPERIRALAARFQLSSGIEER